MIIDPSDRGLPTDFLFIVPTFISFLFLGIPVAFSAGDSLSAGPSHSSWFTYTDDMLESPACSGRSSSTSAVNQPLPGEQATPPARPVMQGAANRTMPYVPFPYDPDEVIGGDSVRSIQRRLLSGKASPSYIEIYLAQIDAEDLFEDLHQGGRRSETFGLLKGKVFLRDTPPSEGSSA
ncbi:hypothetical protein L2E82_53463 [Cichorium intybus]|nr:hypothetical protein L2E82_53463 [Cichorium intybus]